MENDWWNSNGSGEIPPARTGLGNIKDGDEDDLFNFTSEPIFDEEFLASLPPLEPGVEDCIGDRGVLIRRLNSPNGLSSSANGKTTTAVASSAPSTSIDISSLKTAASTAEHENSTAKKQMKPSKEKPYVEFHYAGYVVKDDGNNGEVFDESREYPLITKLDFSPRAESGLIKGLDKALRSLSIGERAEVTIQASYAYGNEGCAPNIPPGATLRFEVNVQDIRSTQKVVLDNSEDVEAKNLSRLDEIRKEREIASLRRQEKEAAKASSGKPDRIEALRQKLAKKNEKGRKKKKK